MTTPVAPAPRTFGQKVGRLTVRLFLLAIAGLLAWLLFIYYAVYSEGSRSGMIIRLSKRGVVFKTWEGQLNMQSFGAMDPKGTSLNEVFNFSVQKGDEELYRQLEAASLSGERVNLHYVERYARLPWRGETTCFVTRVERSGTPADTGRDRSPVGH
ncbi:MAG: 6-phosphogluconate dehydrogenase [Flavobacteriales bacterium]|nr:6-phosphogluconate dehydrogenase [Flavobacteriales bacterium]NUQ14308.1 6-phosphogluconate dehydrogenase [Flavobacteriales bacterium]